MLATYPGVPYYKHIKVQVDISCKIEGNYTEHFSLC